MVCTYCGQQTQVTNSRLQKRLNQTWRRRLCQHCHAVFTTHETVDASTSMGIRYTPTDIRPFQRDTLFISIYESCRHRPKAIEDAMALTSTILSQLMQNTKDGLIDRQEILTTVAAVLHRFDKAAATMYTAYHKNS